ncbi:MULTISPECIES: hypothetical protein [Acidovorax]|uniref:Uncharacterized protein n=1 Tax=Acidovorax facilis TaxID=12917 RepID=A0ABV8DDR7_9BURK|nr:MULTISPECIES: hypothetical protein [Acidovorax]KQB59202.1 hypothetical protein AE621_11480 [Acidovorax sp. SD340]MBO1007809.1 hypothetical protein [Acidovorax sp. SD340]MCO4241306.1 hypothetical protein [Acidovorax facilis]
MARQKPEVTWIGKDQRPRLEPRILLEDPARSHPQLLAKQHAMRVVLDAQQIQHAVRGETPLGRDVRPGVLNPSLSWTHCRTLLKEASQALEVHAGVP